MNDSAMDRLRRENPVPGTMPALPIEPLLLALDAEPPRPERRDRRAHGVRRGVARGAGDASWWNRLRRGLGSGPARGRVRLSRLIVGIVVGLVGLVAAVVVALGAETAAPAFALTRSSDGLVTITLSEITGIAGLNRRFAAMGIRVRAVPIVRGCVAPVRVVGPNHQPEPRPSTLHASMVPGPARNGQERGGYLPSLTLRPPADAGRTAVVAASTSGLALVGAVVRGAAPACVGAPLRPASPFLIPAHG